ARFVAMETESIGKPSCLERAQAGVGIYRCFEDFFGVPGGDFFDLDSSLRAGHQHRHADGSVQDHAQVDFSGNVYRVLHQHFGHTLALVAGLTGNEGNPKHDLGHVAAFFARTHKFDAAPFLAAPFETALATAAGMNLGFENDGARVAVESLLRLAG